MHRKLSNVQPTGNTMSRRKRKRAVQTTPPASELEPVDDLPLDDVLPGPPADRRLVMAEVIARNLLAVAGVIFLGWSGQNLLVLYFFDTLGGLMALFSSLLLIYPNRPQTTLFDRAYWFATALAVGAFLVAFFAVPLGVPVVIMAQMTSWSVRDALADRSFVLALLGVMGLSIFGMLYWSQRLHQDPRGERALKREFALIFGRWVVVIIAILNFSIFFGRFAPLFIVAVYAVTTIYTELYPDRFERLFDRPGRRKG